MSPKKAAEAPVVEPKEKPDLDHSPIGDMVDLFPFESLSEKGRRQRRFLASQPLVKILVPKDPGEPKSAVRRINMNGYSVEIPVSKMVDVPEYMAQFIAECYELDLAALNNPYKLDQGLNEELKRALEVE